MQDLDILAFILSVRRVEGIARPNLQTMYDLYHLRGWERGRYRNQMMCLGGTD